MSTTGKSAGWKFVLCLIVLLAAALTATAQSTVTVNGTVTDPSGAVVANAKITATNVQTGTSTTASTTAEGFYTILSVPPGFYDVSAAQQGFATVVRRAQEFLVGTTVTIDFQLQVSSTAQTVEVSAVAPDVETTQNTVNNILQTAQLDDLPILSRTFFELAALAPGVQTTTQITPGYSVGGAAGGVTIGNSDQRDTAYTIDDIPVTKPSDGGLYVALAQDWVQEFSLVSNQAPAEVAGTISGVVNAVTRRGTNQVHGRAYGFFQNSALNAAAFDPVTPTTSKTPSSSQRVGGMVGGPIFKDKLFYFGGYEYYRNLVGAIFSGVPASFAGSRAVLPGDLVPGSFSNLNRQDLAQAKITYQMNQANSFDFIGNLQIIGEPNAIAGGYTSIYNGNTTRFTADSASMNWTHTFSTTSVNSLRIYDARDGDDETCLYAQKVGAFPISTTALTTYGVTTSGNPTGYYASLAYPGAEPSGTVTVGCNSRWGGEHFVGIYAGIYDTFIKTVGKHEIKFGGQAADPFYGSQLLHSTSDGAYTFLSSQTVPFNPSVAATFPQQLSLQWGPAAINRVMVTGWQYGFFLQDTWKMANNLTLNAGMRWDVDFSYRHFNSDGKAPGGNSVGTDYNTISPRVGMAWTPFADKSTVIRGGVGLFYGPINTNVSTAYEAHRSTDTIIDTFNSNSASANPYCISPGGCGNPATFAAYQADLRALMAWSLVNNTYPNLSLTSVNVGGVTYPLPGFNGTIPQSGVVNIDPTFNAPGTVQATLGLAHSFKNVSLTADYVYSYGFDQLTYRNININPNQPVTSAGAVNFLNTNYTTYNSYGTLSWYSNKQLLAKARYTDRRGDFGAVSYTYSSSWGDSLSLGALSTNPFNFDVDDGPNVTDQRNAVTVNANIRIPGGIEFAPIFTFGSGLPMTPTTTLLAGGSQTLSNGVVVSVPGCQLWYNTCYPARNGVLYTRGSLRGSNTVLFNARLQRTFKLGEKRSITPMFEAYNIPNHVNLGTNYTLLATSTSFGKPSNSTITMRQLQIGARFDF